MNDILQSYTFPVDHDFELVQGDLLQEEVDVIVNAANARLQHGGGIAALISHAGGPVIQQESDAWVRKHGPVSHESPAYTGAGDLPQRCVIHAVGPVWGSGGEDQKLAAAITGSLHLAEELGFTSIAFPAISTGIFGFPKQRAAGVIYQAVQDYFIDFPDSGLAKVRLVVFDQAASQIFEKAWFDFHKE